MQHHRDSWLVSVFRRAMNSKRGAIGKQDQLLQHGEADIDSLHHTASCRVVLQLL